MTLLGHGTGAALVNMLLLADTASGKARHYAKSRIDLRKDYKKIENLKLLPQKSNQRRKILMSKWQRYISLVGENVKLFDTNSVLGPQAEPGAKMARIKNPLLFPVMNDFYLKM